MDISHILIWNVRGLNQRAKRDSVRNIVQSSHADIVCLQETKVARITLRHTLSALEPDFDQFVVLLANGT